MAEADGGSAGAPATSAPISIPSTRSEEGALTDSELALTPEAGNSQSGSGSGASEHAIADTPTLGPTTMTTSPTATTATAPWKSPRLEATLASGPGRAASAASAASSRHPSFSGSSSYQEDWDIPPLDRLSMLDLLDNFALPQQLEKLSKGISEQTRKLRKSGDVLKTRSQGARERMVEEWRHRVPSAEEQLERYRKRMRVSVEKLGRQWNDTRVITMREKVSFICGVLNIFVSGYLIGGFPQFMPMWYTGQILYFMPIRFYTYHRRGYHYFLADLCYFVNLLLLLSIWVLPGSRRLLVAVYCLAFGNNAVAIIMWRNSLVFHSFDKVTSLFIHVMPCATLHCMVHLLTPEQQQARFPAVYALQHAAALVGDGSPGARRPYTTVTSMLAWSTIPYAFWQLSYYFFITVRRRDKIAAGRPTSFTWLRRSYSKTWIGHVVLALPAKLQEPAFMLIQYSYAVLTMLPCPIWFYHRWASGLFLMVVFTWSIYNGATYYIDVFGNRFQKELEAMRQEVAKWQTTEMVAGGNASAGGGGDGTSTTGKHDENSGGGGGGMGHGDASAETDDGENDSTDSHSQRGHGPSDFPEAKEPGAASAAAALATATVSGADWDEGGKDAARRRTGKE